MTELKPCERRDYRYRNSPISIEKRNGGFYRYRVGHEDNFCFSECNQHWVYAHTRKGAIRKWNRERDRDRRDRERTIRMRRKHYAKYSWEKIE